MTDSGSPTDKLTPTLKDLAGLSKDLRQGKSYVRAWMNKRLSSVAGVGYILDFGGGGSQNTRLLQLDPNAQVVTLDVRPDGKPSVVANGEMGLPFKAGAFDMVLALNVLEHLYDFQMTLREASRVLKADGKFLIYVPFLYPRHTAQYKTYFVEDYYRFGPEALRRLLQEAGFSRIQIEACGVGPCIAAANILTMEIPFNWMRLGVFGVSFLMDLLFIRLKRGKASYANRGWPLAYWVTAQK